MFHLIDEIERLRKLWKESEESKKRLNIEMRETEEALAYVTVSSIEYLQPQVLEKLGRSWRCLTSM